MGCRRSTEYPLFQDLQAWHSQLLSRRRFLQATAGGSLAALFPLSGALRAETPDRWRTLAAVQEHLFPSEPGAPGAREIRALDYLKFVVGDNNLSGEDRRFILQGVDWLEDMSGQLEKTSFLQLDEERREWVLRRIAGSQAGENWLSTILFYLFEALLTDPVYGGNPDGIGWRWLGHRPGLPRPAASKRYPDYGY